MFDIVISLNCSPTCPFLFFSKCIMLHFLREHVLYLSVFVSWRYSKLTSFAYVFAYKHPWHPIGCQINSRPTGRFKTVNKRRWLTCACWNDDWPSCLSFPLQCFTPQTPSFQTLVLCILCCCCHASFLTQNTQYVFVRCCSLPEKFLKTGIAESVSTCGNLDGFPHCFATQRTLKASLGLLQELVVKPRHCWCLQ